MITGKAKKDFYDWYNKKGCHYNVTDLSLDLSELMHYTILIAWLDSIGIYIDAHPISYEGDVLMFMPSILIKDELIDIDSPLLTRSEAYKSAIEKAVGIYNNRK